MCDSSDGIGSAAEKEAQMQQAIAAFMQPPFFNDICVRVITTDIATGRRNEEEVLANKFLLAFFSLHLRELILSGLYHISENNGLLTNIPTVELHLGTIANAGQAFRVILRYLYTGVLTFSTVHPFQVLQVSRICQIPVLEMHLTELVKHFFSVQLHGNYCLTSTVLPTKSSEDLNSARTVKQHENQVTAAKSEIKGILTVMDESDTTVVLSNESSSIGKSGNAEKFNELILPSNDKEGWCRNKKYIEQVANGYMCTVCRKVYGRYNSVSYHVTIYHRNPPIKCDEKGCPFRTREARYIHFHKYYRHHIPLPDNIDLGSRKCPFCRHVSKSPAMLEKHISRHVQDVDRTNSNTSSTSPLHFSQCLRATANFQCPHCTYRGRTFDHLEQHKLFAHSSEMFRRKPLTASGGAITVTSEGNNSKKFFGRPSNLLLVDAVKTVKKMVELKAVAPTVRKSAVNSESLCLAIPKA